MKTDDYTITSTDAAYAIFLLEEALAGGEIDPDKVASIERTLEALRFADRIIITSDFH